MLFLFYSRLNFLFPEQQQVEPLTVVQPLAPITRLDVANRRVRRYEYACHKVTSAVTESCSTPEIQ